MRLHVRVFFLLIAVILVTVSASPSWSKENAKIAIILWRGMTEAEKSYQAALKKSDKYDFEFTVVDLQQDRKKLKGIIAVLQKKKYNVIYAFGTIVADALKDEFKDTPIVFNAVARPVEVGLIKSWEHSGNNLTGVSNVVPLESLFVTLRKIINVRRVGFLYNPTEPNAAVQLTEILMLQDKFRYTVIPAPIENDREISAAIRKIVNKKADAVFFPADSFIMSRADIIISRLNDFHVPTVAALPELVSEHKAFIGIGPDYTELGAIAALKTLDILAGKKPDEIPSSRPDRLHIRVNITTAKKIGVNVPMQVLHMATVIQ